MARRKKDRYGLRGEVHFQMAPLIDVVFLLLIFFITVTTFHQTEQVDMILAYAKSAKEYKKTQATMVVNVTTNGLIVSGSYTFYTKDELQSFMQSVVDIRGHTNFKVSIRADQNARMKEIKDVYRAAAHVGLTRISLVTQTRKQEMVERSLNNWDEDEPEEDEETE